MCSNLSHFAQHLPVGFYLTQKENQSHWNGSQGNPGSDTLLLLQHPLLYSSHSNLWLFQKAYHTPISRHTKTQTGTLHTYRQNNIFLIKRRHLASWLRKMQVTQPYLHVGLWHDPLDPETEPTSLVSLGHRSFTLQGYCLIPPVPLLWFLILVDY